MTNVSGTPARTRHAIFAVHGISPWPRYAFLDLVADAWQSCLNAHEDAANSGHSWTAVVHWPHVASKNGETVRPSALRIYRKDRDPHDPASITYDVYEGYWSPLSKGRTNFASAMNWLLNSTFLATSSTANVPCTPEKLKSDLFYVLVFLGMLLAGLLVALAGGLSAWGLYVRTLAGPPSNSVAYWALLTNPIRAAMQLPLLAYLELGIDTAAAYVLAQLLVMHRVGSRRLQRSREFLAQAKKDGGHFRSRTFAAHIFHRDASIVLWFIFVLFIVAAIVLDRFVGHVGWPHTGAAALVTLSVLFFQSARWAAGFAVENVLGDVQVYTTHDQNSVYYSIREQIVQTVSDGLIKVLRTTEARGDAEPAPYYDSIHIFGHSLGSTIAMDVLIHLRQLLEEGTLADKQWSRIRSLITFGAALEKTRFFFDVRHPTVSAAQDQWENDVYGEFFTKDQTVLRKRDNSRGIYWTNLWYLRDIVANEIVSYQSDVRPRQSFVWTAAAKPMDICENHLLPHPRPRLAWVHGDYLKDPLFWDIVRPIVVAGALGPLTE